MSSTIKLQSTTNWAQSYCHQIPLTGQGGIAGEPAVTNANTVRQFILAAPFAWRWNRKTDSSVTTTPGQQDYVVSLPDFGWLEQATISDGTTIWSVEPRLILPEATQQDRPLEVAPVLDDDAGNITFRLFPVPDAAYPLKLTYQRKALIFGTLTALWSPIPDELAYLYNSGFLAAAFENIDDARFQVEYQKFVKNVIAANAGLTETEINLFLSERLINQRQQADTQLGAQQGKGARG